MILFFSKIIEQYNRRVNFYIEFEIKTVPDVKNTKSLSEKEQKIQEGNSILKLLQPSDHIVLLDDKGKQYSSVEFAGFIEKNTLRS